MNNKFYTYAYLREDGTPYYIGKGEGRRAYCKQNRSCPVPKDRKRIIFLKKNIDEEEAFKHEEYMISVFGRKDLGTGILRNLTNGGEGASGAVRSEEMRQHLSEIKTGKRMTDEFRENCRERMKNFRHSEEAKNKISSSNKGRKWSKQSLENISKVRKEMYQNGVGAFVNLTPEQRKKAISKANETNKRNNTGAWGLTAEERSERGKKNYHKTIGRFSSEQLSEFAKKANSIKWKCLVTGYITTAGPLTRYQKARGIDVSLREKVSMN